MKSKLASLVFVDFEDSFSANIIAELKLRANQVLVYKWTNILKDKNLLLNEKFIVLGPGPGHIDDYEQLSPILAEVLTHNDIIVWGICLGHQLLWSCLGGEISPSSDKSHGQSSSIELPFWPGIFSGTDKEKQIKVQRYNSWTITANLSITSDYLLDKINGEVMGFYKKNIIGFQFHPESIGTEKSEVFFDWITNPFLHHFQKKDIVNYQFKAL